MSVDGDGRLPSMDLPDAISAWERIAPTLGPQPIYFFDFDGTLAPLVAHFDDAIISASVRSLLENLSTRATVGIVSGRAVSDVRARVGLGGLIYAGSHGQEIELPDGKKFLPVGSSISVEDLDRIEADLRSHLEGIDGINLERKPMGIVVHTREARSARERARAKAIAEASAYPGVALHMGKEILEFRPDTSWDKGSAIEFLCRELDRTGPVFIGDDETDEDGFVVVNRLGGVGVIVSPLPDRRTHARFTLATTDAVEELLRIL